MKTKMRWRVSGEDEETDEDEDEQKEGSSGSDDDKEKKEKRRGAKDKRQDFTDVMGMFGEEDGSEYLNDIQRLHAAVVVDELQQGLSRTLGSKASIGSQRLTVHRCALVLICRGYIGIRYCG